MSQRAWHRWVALLGVLLMTSACARHVSPVPSTSAPTQGEGGKSEISSRSNSEATSKVVPAPSRFYSVHLASPDEAWAVTDVGFVVSHDGGLRWRNRSPEEVRQSTVRVSSVARLSASQWWLIAVNERTAATVGYSTTDDGKSWTRHAVPSWEGGEVFPVDSDNAWLSVM